MMIENGELFSLVDNLIADITAEIDDRMWANPDDPKIEKLQRELEELKKERKDGIRYRPNF